MGESVKTYLFAWAAILLLIWASTFITGYARCPPGHWTCGFN